MNLETNRLIIRPFLSTDFDDYFAYIMESELQNMLGLNGVNDEETALKTFQWLLDNRELFALIQKEEGRAIGHICMHPPIECLLNHPTFHGKNGCSLSFAIAKWVRRKGLMKEALLGFIDALFVRRQMDYIDCEYTESNTASHALQEKLGFRYWAEEQFGDEELIINVLRREDWKSKQILAYWEGTDSQPIPSQQVSVRSQMHVPTQEGWRRSSCRQNEMK